MYAHGGRLFRPVGNKECVVRSRNERSRIAGAGDGLVVVADPQFVTAEIENQFEGASRKYPLVFICRGLILV